MEGSSASRIGYVRKYNIFKPPYGQDITERCGKSIPVPVPYIISPIEVRGPGYTRYGVKDNKPNRSTRSEGFFRNSSTSNEVRGNPLPRPIVRVPVIVFG